MIADRIGRTVDFVLPQDRALPPEQQTVFQLQTLSARNRARVTDAMLGLDVTGQATLTGAGTGCLVACLYGLAGWRNLRDAAGNEVVFKMRRQGGASILTDESLDAISSVVQDLAREILRVNELTETDRGNSPSSPTSRPPGQAAPGEMGTSGNGSMSAHGAAASSPSPAPQPVPSAGGS